MQSWRSGGIRCIADTSRLLRSSWGWRKASYRRRRSARLPLRSASTDPAGIAVLTPDDFGFAGWLESCRKTALGQDWGRLLFLEWVRRGRTTVLRGGAHRRVH